MSSYTVLYSTTIYDLALYSADACTSIKFASGICCNLVSPAHKDVKGSLRGARKGTLKDTLKGSFKGSFKGAFKNLRVLE